MKHENGNGGGTRRALICALAFPIALIGGGCELIPGLLNSPTPSVRTTSLFDVTVVEASGTLGGPPIGRDSVAASGLQTGTQTTFDLQLTDRETRVQINLQPSDNPYGGRPGEPLDAGPLPPRADAGPPPPHVDDDPAPPMVDVGRVGAGPEPLVISCTGVERDCQPATEVQLEDRQGIDARTLVLEARWASGDTLHLELRYATVE